LAPQWRLFATSPPSPEIIVGSDREPVRRADTARMDQKEQLPTPRSIVSASAAATFAGHAPRRLTIPQDGEGEDRRLTPTSALSRERLHAVITLDQRLEAVRIVEKALPLGWEVVNC